MASGKSSVGHLVAQRLGAAFLDVDALIEAKSGRRIADIFTEEGEAAFRRMEAATVRELLPLRRVVVALGGGALTDPALRREIRETGTLAILAVSAGEALRRAKNAPDERPLLHPERAATLLASRTEAYADGHLAIETDGKTVEAVAAELLRALPTPGRTTPVQTVQVEGRHAAGITTLFVGCGLLPKLKDLLAIRAMKMPFVVGDTLTAALFAPNVRGARGLARLPRGEEAKSLDAVRGLYDAFADAKLDRSDAVLALGGGTVGDSAGFAAATWMRGVKLIQCPTTLLAQVDSSLGGKVGVNLPQGKNLVGAFHQPEVVLADVATLQTLADEEFRQGLGEAVKYAVGEDPALLPWLEAERHHILRRRPETLVKLVSWCARLKLAVVEEDERETSSARARLNLGHTVAHGLEAATDFEGWKHGDAVAAGLAAALALGVREGSCSPSFAERVSALLDAFGLRRRGDLPWERIRPFIEQDKKFTGGRSRLVLPVEGEKCALREMPLAALEAGYREAATW